MDPDFTVVAYRGAFVFSRDAWIADAKARGGAGPTRIGSGFWHDASAFRFGDAVPYTYELAPAWLLVDDGIDVAADEASRVLGAAMTGGDNTLVGSVVADNLPGDASGASGIRPWVLGAIIVGAVAIYAMGVTAGVFPPLGKLLRSK